MYQGFGLNLGKISKMNIFSDHLWSEQHFWAWLALNLVQTPDTQYKSVFKSMYKFDFDLWREEGLARHKRLSTLLKYLQREYSLLEVQWKLLNVITY